MCIVWYGYSGQRDDLDAGWMEQDSKRFHHGTLNGMQFKAYELFLSGVFHLIFSDLEQLKSQKAKLWMGGGLV